MSKTHIELPWFESRDYQGYRKSCGYTLTAKGRKVQKVWYLGSDQPKALQYYLFIKSVWQDCQGRGNAIWTAEALERCQDYKQRIYGRTAVHKRQEEPQEPKESALTFHRAIDLYCQQVIPTVSGSDQWRRDLGYRMEYLKRSIGEDIPLSEVDHNGVAVMAAYWKRRPSKEGSDEPISVEYARTQIRTLQRLLTWLQESGRWEGWLGWQKVLRLQGWKPKLTDSEVLEQSSAAVNGQAHERFSVDELALLYANASDLTKAYMLLSLNCGFTQIELSTLMRGELYLDHDPPMIVRARRKVSKIDKPTVGKWALWDESVAVCQGLLDGQYFGQNKRVQVKPSQAGLPPHIRMTAREYTVGMDDKAARLLGIDQSWLDNPKTRDSIKQIKWADLIPLQQSDWLWGKPLVYLDNKSNSRIDLVKNGWFRLLRKPMVKGKVQALPFKYIRKTSADMIREIAGSHVAQLFLCHAPTTTADRHYINQPVDELFSALAEMRQRLDRVFKASSDAAKP